MTNPTLLQYFEWYLPENGLHWQLCQTQAQALKAAGITGVWLPPAYKGAAGKNSVGYDVYDTYDLGEFQQKGTIATKYGTKEDYEKAVKAFQDAGIEVLADIVLNHMMGADETEAVMAEETSVTNREEDISGKQEIRHGPNLTFPEEPIRIRIFIGTPPILAGPTGMKKISEMGFFVLTGNIGIEKQIQKMSIMII